jgi:hypothetical protein
MQLFLRKIGILEHDLKLSTAERHNAEAETGEEARRITCRICIQKMYIFLKTMYILYIFCQVKQNLKIIYRHDKKSILTRLASPYKSNNGIASINILPKTETQYKANKGK